MERVLEIVSRALGTDVETMWKSIFSGTSSTGLGIYIANVSQLNWHFELNIVSLVWGAVSCVILTLLSLLVSDLYKLCKKRLKKER